VTANGITQSPENKTTVVMDEERRFMNRNFTPMLPLPFQMAIVDLTAQHSEDSNKNLKK